MLSRGYFNRIVPSDDGAIAVHPVHDVQSSHSASSSRVSAWRKAIPTNEAAGAPTDFGVCKPKYRRPSLLSSPHPTLCVSIPTPTQQFFQSRPIASPQSYYSDSSMTESSMATPASSSPVDVVSKSASVIAAFSSYVYQKSTAAVPQASIVPGLYRAEDSPSSSPYSIDEADKWLQSPERHGVAAVHGSHPAFRHRGRKPSRH